MHERLAYLQLIPDVDHECTRDGVNGEPLAVLENLKASHLQVLEQNGEGIWVRVTRKPVGQLGLGAGRVKIHGHVLPLLAQDVPNVALLESKALRYQFLQSVSEFSDFTAVITHNLPVKDTNQA